MSMRVSRCFFGRGLAVSRALNRVWDSHRRGFVVATILRRSRNWVHFCPSCVSIFVLIVSWVWKHAVIAFFLNLNWIVLARGLRRCSFSWDRNNDSFVSDHISWALSILNSRDAQSVVFRMSSSKSLIISLNSSSVNILNSNSNSSITKVLGSLNSINVSESIRCGICAIS